MLVSVAVAATVWGALAFGAVYPWAFTPLAIGCASVGVAALVAGSHDRPPMGMLAVALIAVGVAIGAQLVPLPAAVLARISPNSAAFLPQYGSAPWHPLSIGPDKTMVGLGLFAGFALFVLGLARLVSVVGASAIARPVVFFGVVLAIVGIAQYTLTVKVAHPLIYGFWKPTYESRPFGPFVNPNHFAGWMLMVLPVALAAFYDALLRTVHSIQASGRDRMAILNSPSFGAVLMFALCSVVMGLSLVMTKSRSGMSAFAVGSALACWTVFRKQKSRSAKAAVAASFVLLLAGTIAWAGLSTIAEKFVESKPSVGSAGGRMDVYRDTAAIARQFPATGTGLDTYGTAMILYQSGNRSASFQEAHNDYLQLAAEGGLLVCVPVALTIAIFIRDVRRRFREAPKEGTTYWLRVGAVVGLISIALQSLVEFSLQMPGNAALFAMIAAIALHQSPNLRTPSTHARASK